VKPHKIIPRREERRATNRPPRNRTIQHSERTEIMKNPSTLPAMFAVLFLLASNNA
jgi:hypothetical protein